MLGHDSTKHLQTIFYPRMQKCQIDSSLSFDLMDRVGILTTQKNVITIVFKSLSCRPRDFMYEQSTWLGTKEIE
jgi:hypothetical protein